MPETNFPDELDVLTNPEPGDGTVAVSHSLQHKRINDAMEAVQGLLGKTASVVVTTVTYRLAQLESSKQAADATLTAIAGVITAADKFIYFTGVDTAAAADITAFGRSLIDDADASAGRSTLGLGTMATQDANNVAISGGFVNTAGSVIAGSLTATNTSSGTTDVLAQNQNASAAAACARVYCENDSSTRLAMRVYGGLATVTGYGLTLANYALLESSGAAGVGLIVGAATADPLIFGTNNLERARFLGGGSLLIGTTTDDAINLVQVNGALFASAINVGHASDATIARVGAGDVSVEGNIVYRAGGTDVPVTDGGTGASTAAGARTNLGLAIGTDVQAYDAELAALAGLTSAANKIPMFSGSGTATLIDLDADTTLAANSDARVATQKAVKAYVDGLANGVDWKASVRVATTANITLSGAQTIDGVAVVAGERVLVKDQATASQNGIYVCAAGAWSRATDADASAEVTGGLAVWVNEGITNADTGWVITTNDAITLGTTALAFTQFSGLGQVTAGAALTKTGSQLDVAVDNSSIEVSADALRVKAAGVTNTMLAGSIAASKLVGTDIATVGTITAGVWNGTDIAVADGGTGASDAATARANLGLGTIATQASSSVSITGGSISGITDLAIADGGTGASTAVGGSDSLSTKGADIASAATTDLGAATGTLVDITGTTSITSFGVAAAGVERTLRFAAALTLTHNATSLILPGAANITTASGDTAIVRSLGGGNWRCVTYQRAASAPVSGTNTGDQTITLTGDVTGSGAGSFAATIAAGAVGTSKLGGDITTAGKALLDDADATAQRSTLGLAIGTNVQAYDATLAALAAYNTNGLLAQTAADTFAGRTLTGTANQIAVTNGDGVSGNPTLSLPADVLIPTVITAPNTGLHLLDTDASHDLIVAPGSNLTADRTLTITTGDANRTLTLSGNATLSGGSHSGTNTGDQTITLTGDVTGSGAASFAATIANGAVTLGKLVSTLSVLDLGAETSVTGAVTATLGKMHICTGTTADYTVTLPTAVGNAGRIMGFRMGSTTALTKLVTLDGNAAETIDGAATRVMWSNEVAILESDGTEWRKIAGKTIPMVGRIHNTASQTGMTSGAFTTLTLTTSDIDIGAMNDATNSRITPRRSGNYQISAGARITTGNNIARLIIDIYDATVGALALSEMEVSGSTTYPAPNVASIRNIAAGRNVTARIFHNTGVNQSTSAESEAPTFLCLQEIPSW